MADTTWTVQLPNVPTDHGPSFEATVLAAINEIRAKISGAAAPAAPTVDALGGATAIGKSILKAQDAAAVRTLLNVAEKTAA